MRIEHLTYRILTSIFFLILFACGGSENKNADISNLSIPIGQAARIDYFEITINKVELSDKVKTGNRFTNLKSEPGNKFLIFNITFKNIDTESRLFIEGDILINYNNKDYIFDHSELIIADGWGSLLDQLNPLTSKTTNLVYKIPNEITGNMYWRPSRNSNDVIFDLGKKTDNNLEISDQYSTDIKKEREEKDVFFKQDKESPFNISGIKSNALKYFEPNSKYVINADLELITNKKEVALATSDGKKKKYLEYAYASFKLDDLKSKLLILEIADIGPYKGTLFLAFTDDTSTKETFGAGRYLDLKKVPGATTVTLDFNKAYNPYCAYSEKFSCPFPPRENQVRTAIKAGEKKYN